MDASTNRTGRIVAVGLGILALTGIALWLTTLRTANDRSDQVDQLTNDLATASAERDALAAEVDRAEAGSSIIASRWLSSVAVSETYSPAQSRLLAVEAATRSSTPESNAALGRLLFADARSQPPTIELEHHGPVWDVAVGSSDDVVVTGSHDATAKVWSSTGDLLATLASPDRVQTVDLSADDRFIATGSLDGSAIVWTVNGDQVALAEHDDRVNDVALSSTGSLMISGGHDNAALLTNTETGTIQHQLLHPDIVWTVALSSDGQRAATGGQDGRARIWDVTTGDEIAAFEIGKQVATLDFSPDGRWLFAGGQGGEAILIDTATVEDAPPLEGAFSGGIIDVEWHPGGAELAIVSLGGIHRYDLSTRELLAEHRVAGGARGVAYSPDGDWFVSGSGDFQFSFGQIIYWDTLTGTEMVSLNLGGPVETIAVHSTGTVLAGFRMVEDLVETGGAWLAPGPDEWIDLACSGTDGIISKATWSELTGEDSSHETSCP